jgi:hypothetical protein
MFSNHLLKSNNRVPSKNKVHAYGATVLHLIIV